MMTNGRKYTPDQITQETVDYLLKNVGRDAVFDPNRNYAAGLNDVTKKVPRKPDWDSSVINSPDGRVKLKHVPGTGKVEDQIIMEPLDPVGEFISYKAIPAIKSAYRSLKNSGIRLNVRC